MLGEGMNWRGDFSLYRDDIFFFRLPSILSILRSLMKDDRMESNKKNVADVAELEEDFM